MNKIVFPFLPIMVAVMIIIHLEIIKLYIAQVKLTLKVCRNKNSFFIPSKFWAGCLKVVLMTFLSFMIHKKYQKLLRSVSRPMGEYLNPLQSAQGVSVNDSYCRERKYSSIL
jgi:hypothetical protein